MRCAFSMTVNPPDRAYLFGGVFDEEDEEDEDDDVEVQGFFHNDLYSLDLIKNSWHPGKPRVV